MLYFIVVGDKNMLSFIRDKTADPYFWNLVWFIGNHAIELDNCVLRESQWVESSSFMLFSLFKSREALQAGP